MRIGEKFRIIVHWQRFIVKWDKKNRKKFETLLKFREIDFTITVKIKNF